MKTLFASGGGIDATASAAFSPCGQYRYVLTRRWDARRACVFVMLNPSTADAYRDDPTIRRCINFAKREHCGGLIVVNLFALRATKPDDMLAHTHPIAEAANPTMNDDNIKAICSAPDLIIAAWGSHGNHKQRAMDVLRILANRKVYALWINADGTPKHPLYVAADAPLIPFNDAAKGLLETQ